MAKQKDNKEAWLPSVRVTEEIRNSLEDIATARGGVGLSTLMREAIIKFVESENAR
jgi:predicted transcriptional regulator